MKKLLIVLSLFILSSCVSGPSGSNNIPQQRQIPQGNLNENVNPYDENQVYVLGSLSKTALGKNIGEYITKMNEEDRYNLAIVFKEQPLGQTKRWFNDQNETVFAITPTRQHQYTDGSICKEYVIETQNQNDVKEYYGRACKEDENTWIIVN